MSSRLTDNLTNLKIASEDNNPESFLKTIKFTKLLENDLSVEFLITEYSDRFLIVATSIEKPGSIWDLRRISNSQNNTSILKVSSLLGEEKEDFVLGAKAIGEALNLSKPCLLCLGFKQLSPSLIKSIISSINSKI